MDADGPVGGSGRAGLHDAPPHQGACGAAGEGVTTDADPARPGGAMRDEARPCKPDCNLAESGADGLGLSRLPLTMFIFPSTNVEAKMNTELAHAHRGEKAD